MVSEFDNLHASELNDWNMKYKNKIDQILADNCISMDPGACITSP